MVDDKRRGKGELPSSLHAAADAASRVNETLGKMGIKKSEDGGLVLSAEALATIQAERERRSTISRVPSTPRHMPREAGGVGVRKGIGLQAAISMETLRVVRERAPVIQAIHAAREMQVRRLSVKWPGKRGEVGWRVVHKDYSDRDAEQPEGFAPWIKRFESILEEPAPTYGLTATSPLFTMIEEDLLTLNRPVVEVLESAIAPGRVVGMRPVDAALVWSTQAWVEKWMNENPGWYGPWSPGALTEAEAMDLLQEKMKIDVGTKEYCLVRDGVVEAQYDRHRLIVAPAMNRTDIKLAGYYPSKVEQALEVILTFINTWDYNASFFTRGMMAEFVLGISGAIHDDDLDAFADTFRQATQGVRRAWQPPMIPMPEGGKLEKLDLKPANREMMYEVFLSLQIALATAVYRMDPSTINAKPWDGGGGSHLGGDSGRGTEIALAKEEGLQGDMQHVCEAILTPLARRCHPDLRVVMEYGDFDPQKEAAIYEVRSRVDMTRNEVRLEQGMTPKGFWVPDHEYDDLSDEDKEKYDQNPWNMPTDPGFASIIQQQSAQAQQLQQMQQQAQFGDPGQDGDPNDDGFGNPDDPNNDDGFGGQKPQAPFGQPGGAQGGPGGGGAPPQQGPPGAPAAPRPQAAPMRKGRRRAGRTLTVYVERWT